MIDLRNALEFMLHLFNCLLDGKVGAVKNPAGSFDLIPDIGRGIGPAETDNINSGNPGRISVGNNKRRHIFDDFGAAADHR